MLKFLIGVPALFEGSATPPDITGITGTVTSLISSLLTWMSSLTGWILGDPLAVTFFAIMFIMLAIHVINSLVHKFS